MELVMEADISQAEPVSEATPEPIQSSEPVAEAASEASAQESFNWDEWDPDDIDSLKEEWREPVSKAVGRYKFKVDDELERHRSILQMYQESAVTKPEYEELRAKYDDLLPKYKDFEEKIKAWEIAQEEDIARSVAGQIQAFESRYAEDLQDRQQEYAEVMNFIADNDCGDDIPEEVLIDIVRADEEDRGLYLQVLKGAGHQALSKVLARSQPKIKAPVAPVLAVTKPKTVAPPAPAPKIDKNARLHDMLMRFGKQLG